MITCRSFLHSVGEPASRSFAIPAFGNLMFASICLALLPPSPVKALSHINESGASMSLQSEKSPGNIKLSWDGLVARGAAALLVPALMCSAFVASAARATTLLDPLPEDSSTQFGRAIIDLADVDGDGISDLGSRRL